MKTLYFFFFSLFPLLLFGQGIMHQKSMSDSEYPEITWYTIGDIDSTAFQVFRADMQSKNFVEIHTISYTKELDTGDTIEFAIVDTTLTEKGLYMYYIEVNRNGKKIKSEVVHGHNFGLLPRPTLFSFKATPLTDRKAVRLDWKFNYAETIKTMSLYRSNRYDTGYVKVAELANDIPFYEDPIPLANEPWFYYMVIHDFYGDQLPSIRIPAFATFAEKPFRPQNISKNTRNDSVFINWEIPGDNVVGYRVFRSIDGMPYAQINEMVQTKKKEGQFVDVSPEIKNALRLKYYVRNVSDGFLESNSSDTLNFYFPDREKVLPPKVVDFLRDDTGELKLLWIPPDEGRVLGYNVYLTDPLGKTLKLNKRVLEVNYFIDSLYRTAGKYTYSIEGVGYKNKVSERKTAISIGHYPPGIHVILDLKKQKDGLEVSWKKPLNNHITQLKLYKVTGQQTPGLEGSFSPDEDVRYLDHKVSSGNTYLYRLVAVMSDRTEISLNDGVEIIW